MRKFFLLLLFAAPLFGQVSYQEGSAIGFGFSSPRIFGDVRSEYLDFGGHIAYQKDFDEVNSFRVKMEFLNFTSAAAPVTGLQANTFSIGMHGDYLFTFTPCSPMRSYVGAGIGIEAYKVKDAADIKSDEWKAGELCYTFIIGSRYAVSPEWDLKAEFTHSTVSTDKFDGTIAQQGGLFGGVLDSYITAEIGALYYFSRGPKTEYCEAPGGLTKNYYSQAVVDYEKIKKMIDEAQPKHVASDIDYAKIENMIDKKLEKLAVPKEVKQQPAVSASGAELALVGINFNQNSAVIRPENYSILAQAAATLLGYPSLKVEIQGYTDAQGGEKGNQKLSEKRANAVKNYLVSKGVDASRLTIAGFGEKKPVSENTNAEGRALNRRVEFKIVK